MKKLLALTACTSALPAFAHGGHGAALVHWHASDTIGVLVLAALVGAAIWLSRGK